MTTNTYEHKLAELHAKLAEADALVKRYTRPVHTVGNCISDQERSTEAVREWQNIQYQISELEKTQKTY
jgi:hypothetical protein